MSRPVHKREKETYGELIIYILCVLVLIFSSVNIYYFLSPKKVLGASVEQKVSEKEFWDDFLRRNPTYIPGWIEIGRNDRVKEIDPNYIMP